MTEITVFLSSVVGTIVGMLLLMIFDKLIL